MVKIMKILGILTAALCLAGVSPAMADQFDWTYTGTGDSGSGTITATPSGPNTFSITGISGTWDGSLIAGLLPLHTCCSFPANDNVLNFPTGPFLTLGGLGLGFGVDGGATDVNIYYSGSYLVLTAPASNPGADVLTSTSGTFVVTPEPTTIALLGSGLVGLMLRKRRARLNA
jgi:PEP-CTERM motif